MDSFDDRSKWDRAWSSKPHRRLDTALKIDITQGLPQGLKIGKVVSATISEDPAEFSDQVLRQCAECPICGQTTIGMSRLAASLHPLFETGINNISIGVWVHNNCFENCPDTGEPSPIPW